MTKALPENTKPPFLRWLNWPARVRALEDDKARLEAFLGAFPGAYCGWAPDGSAVYSRGFCDAFGLAALKTFDDIQNTLMPSDAAALESLFSRLQKNGRDFSVTAQTLDQKRTLKITGSQGRDLTGRDHYDVLWVEDVTDEVAARGLFIQESEEKDSEIGRLQSALDAVPRPLWMRDESQNIVWCNDTYADFLGTSKDEVLKEQKEIFGQLRGKKKVAVDNEVLPGPELAAKALAENKASEARVHNTIKGRRMLMKITEAPIPGVNMTMGVAYNVTREEELETELTRYQSSNRELLEKLRSAIGIFSTDETLEFYNSAFAQLWGIEDKWLNRKPKLGDLMEKLRETRRLPEQADFRRFKQSWLDMFTGLIEPHEDMLYLPDGSALRMLVVPHSMGGLMMTFEDVTSRLELESSYNTLIAVQKETLDNLAEAVAVYGGDGRLKLSNPSFARLWGLHPEDLEGEPHISTIVEKKKGFFSADKWAAVKKVMLAKALERIMREGRLERSDGTLIDYTTVPLPDGGVLITYFDVTDKVRVETALRDKNAALEAAERLKLDFLANVSYQLRTPLNAIMGFNEILENEYFGDLNERQKSYTHDIKAASERLLGLINDILDLSTLEAGYMTLERDDVSVYQMVHAVGDLVAEWARKQKIELEVKCPKNIGSMRVDQRRLQQAIINLIRNAIAFTPPGGTITISAKRKKEGIFLSVSDTGVGISEADMKRIFEPFERAKGGRRSASGAGLGLSLVRNIIALHGGNVDVQSEKDKGTTVTLMIPFTAVPTELRLPVKS